MQIENTKAPEGLALKSLSHAGNQSRWRNEAMRSHDTARLIHITKGQGRITVAGLTNGYGPNNLIYLPPQTMYGLEIGPTVFGQMLTMEDTTELPETSFHLRLMDVDPQKEAVGLFEAIERELQPQGDIRAARCYFGLLKIFLERQLRARPADTGDERRGTAAAKLVARYTNLIAKDYSATRSVAAYAAALDVTPTHLNRCCRKTCGRSAHALLDDRVHYEACRMLYETKRPVSQIAKNLGYRSAAYFTRRFQENAGITPTDFRNNEIGHKA